MVMVKDGGYIALVRRVVLVLLLLTFVLDEKSDAKESFYYHSGQIPQLECPGNISTYTDINECSAFIADGLNPGFDESVVVTLTWEMVGAMTDASSPQGINLIDDHTFDEGTTIITDTARGTDGTTATCTFTITISDNQVPRLENIPPNITVVAAPGQCTATAFWMEPVAADNCSPVGQIRIEGTARPGDTFPGGTTRVYYRAYDAMGNESTVRSFTVTVEDRQPPELAMPPDLTLSCSDPVPGPWRTWQQFVEAGGSGDDNCSLDEFSFRWLSETADAATCPYTLTRTYQISDAAGNKRRPFFIFFGMGFAGMISGFLGE